MIYTDFDKQTRLLHLLTGDSISSAKNKVAYVEAPGMALRSILSDNDFQLWESVFYTGKGHIRKARVRDGAFLVTGDASPSRARILKAIVEELGADDNRVVTIDHDKELVDSSEKSMEFQVANVSSSLFTRREDKGLNLIDFARRMRPNAIVLEKISRDVEKESSFWQAANMGHSMFAGMKSNSFKNIIPSKDRIFHALEGIIQHQVIDVEKFGQVLLTAVVPIDAKAMDAITSYGESGVEAYFRDTGVVTIEAKIANLVDYEVLEPCGTGSFRLVKPFGVLGFGV